jgi:hypothetical protein
MSAKEIEKNKQTEALFLPILGGAPFWDGYV